MLKLKLQSLATWCRELTHLKRPWCWERLKAGGEGVDRGRDCWMASPTQCMQVWVSSGSWWWTGKPGVLQSMGSQRVRHDWASELNWCKGTIAEAVSSRRARFQLAKNRNINTVLMRWGNFCPIYSKYYYSSMNTNIFLLWNETPIANWAYCHPE